MTRLESRLVFEGESEVLPQLFERRALAASRAPRAYGSRAGGRARDYPYNQHVVDSVVPVLDRVVQMVVCDEGEVATKDSKTGRLVAEFKGPDWRRQVL